MKKLGLIVVTLLVAGTVSSWAQTNAFTVSVKGTITQQDGTKVKVGDVSKGVSSLVTNPANVLVVIVDQDSPNVLLAEVDPQATSNTTAIVRSIAETWSFASTVKGNFNTDLEEASGVTPFTTLPAFFGDLQLSGKSKVKNDVLTGVSGKLAGVWMDPVLADTNLPPAIFSGSLKSTGTITVPSDY
jgi:hypothetical protein